MTTIIDSKGRVKGFSKGTLVQSVLHPKGEITAVKAIRTGSFDPGSGGLITFDGVAFDTAGFLSYPSTNIVIPQNGWYSIVAYVNTQTYTANTGLLSIKLNGNDLHADRNSHNTASGGFNAMSIGVAAYYLVRGDIITMSWDSNGVSLAMTSGEAGCSCTVWRVG